MDQVLLSLDPLYANGCAKLDDNSAYSNFGCACRDCLDRPDICRFMKPAPGLSDSQAAHAKEAAAQQAWFVLHPHGDFNDRVAW